MGVMMLAVNGQIDDFTCPDEFEGYYPHFFSCDKYWKCIDGRAELKLCGNGLAFADPDDCTAFYNCMDGFSNRHMCAPGLAFDREDRVCKWADQVQECKKQKEEAGEGEFVCPQKYTVGIFTKHASPTDCRQYFVCISGTAREYGCPLGTVFQITNDDPSDGKCADPEEVDECRNYYGDLDFDKKELVRAGADPEAVGAPRAPAVPRTRVNRPTFTNT